MVTKFVVYHDKAGRFRFRLLAANGEIIAVGEGYRSKEACFKGIHSIQRNAPIAVIEDATKNEAEEKAPARKRAARKPAAKKPVARKAAPRAKKIKEAD